MKHYISRKMIEDGLMANVIVPKLDHDGLTCYIGDYWFWFGGHEYEFTDPKNIGFGTLVEEIKIALDSFFYDDEEAEDEYEYYYSYLCENI